MPRGPRGNSDGRGGRQGSHGSGHNIANDYSPVQNGQDSYVQVIFNESVSDDEAERDFEETNRSMQQLTIHGYQGIEGSGYNTAHDASNGQRDRHRGFLGKHTRDESQEDDIVLALKGVKTTNNPSAQRLSSNQVDVKLDKFGNLLHAKPLDPNGPKFFSMPSTSVVGATDVVMHTGKEEGWQAMAEAGRLYKAQGFTHLFVTVRPILAQGKPSEDSNGDRA